ncbi:hypothetical protein [Litorilituus lipolyticus]|uniref:Uncharacterized protein n=1 Tax=Litorilituus lipolyticus TaxID=2491017 RepID=A0A502KWT7_9GAMM|nr:hypothetical protein [Litorilituus lipolyticus]TPH15534.1 hypothetical protein EPA86_08090 [Litorilituus lipolyticus]
MINLFKKLQTNVLAIFIFTVGFPVYASDSFPSILNYYPLSDYQVIKSYTAKKKTKEPYDIKTTQALIKKLKNKGASIGADAVIIIEKKVKKTLNSAKSYGHRQDGISEFYVSYEAELIKYSQGDVKLSSRATPYNEKGYKQVKSVITTARIKTKFVFKPPVKPKLHRPEVLTNEVSAIKGIYGLTISSTYEEVRETLGDPSVELQVSTDELILGYGRSHWFHFKNNEVVKVQTRIAPLSTTLLNEIPLLDFYDDKVWFVNGAIERNASLTKVKEVLGSDLALNNKNQIIVKEDNATLILHFDYSIDHETNKKHFYLSDFTLQSSEHLPAKLQASSQREAQFDAISGVYAKLQAESGIDAKLLESQLGNPVGRIYKSASHFLTLFNSNLYVETKREDIRSISFVEEVFAQQVSRELDIPWYLNEFKQDGKLDEMRQKFPIEAFELDNEVSIDTDNYQVTLYFEESKGASRLYEAKLVIY